MKRSAGKVKVWIRSIGIPSQMGFAFQRKTPWSQLLGPGCFDLIKRSAAIFTTRPWLQNPHLNCPHRERHRALRRRWFEHRPLKDLVNFGQRCWRLRSPLQEVRSRGCWYIPSKKVNPEIGVQINTKRSKKAQFYRVWETILWWSRITRNFLKDSMVIK